MLNKYIGIDNLLIINKKRVFYIFTASSAARKIPPNQRMLGLNPVLFQIRAFIDTIAAPLMGA
jgi:hypothetical protein